MLRNTGQANPLDYGIFTGFDIKYPDFTVITPQTGLEFKVRPLLVDEAGKLRSTLTTPNKVAELINHILWDGITDKPDIINTFDNLLKLQTLKDREALLYGLYVITFGDNMDANVVCQNCNANRSVKIDLSKIFSINIYPGTNSVKRSYELAKLNNPDVYDPEVESELQKEELQKRQRKQSAKKEENTEQQSLIDDVKPNVYNNFASVEDFINNSILSKEIAIDLDLSFSPNSKFNKIVCILKSPTLEDEYLAINEAVLAQKAQLDFVNETLRIKRFDAYYDDNGTTKIYKIENRIDIMREYKKFPLSAKKKILEAYKENFDAYSIDLKAKWTCMNCNTENNLNIDIVSEFFRLAFLS